MIFTNAQLARLSIKHQEDKDILVFADVHGMSCRQASVFIANIINAARIAFKLVVCHGFNHGTAIKDMLRNSFQNVYILEEHEIPSNPGCTCFSIAWKRRRGEHIMAEEVRKTAAQVAEDQTAAAFADMLRLFRMDERAEGLAAEAANKAAADGILQDLKDSAAKVIDTNRGGAKGMHGFLMERLQCYGENAKSAVQGDILHYRLIDDNGPADYYFDNIPIQAKTCRSGGMFGLDHVAEHADTYVWFKVEGVYHIPRDFYNKVTMLLNTPADVAGKFTREQYRQWTKVQDFFREHPDLKVKSMAYDYDQCQIRNVEKTIQTIETDVRKTNKSRKAAVVEATKPTLQEGIEVTGSSAVFEGCLEGAAEIIAKARDGKRPLDYGKEDWKDVRVKTAAGAGKGAVRGAAVYGMVNYMNIPSPAAAGTVTMAFCAVSEGKKLNDGEIDKTQFALNMAEHASDAAVSAAGAAIGRALFPKHKMAGAIIGSIIASFGWNYAKNAVKKYAEEHKIESETL